MVVNNCLRRTSGIDRHPPMKSPDNETRLVHIPVNVIRRERGKRKRDRNDGVFDSFAAALFVCFRKGYAEVDDGEL